MFFDDGRVHTDVATEPDPALIDLALPFCPTDRSPCSEESLAWLQLRVSIDAYTARRNDPHDSIATILDTTRSDVAPLAEALTRHFADAQVSSDLARVAFVQGLVQVVTYAFDRDTGWTDYPKFGIEFLVDEQGDCDDAAILNTLLLEALGYSSYFVYWKGEPSDHLSTAIEPATGDLSGVSPPAGSPWIESPGLPRLLLVDATGSQEGCGQAWMSCGAVGRNPWPERGLKVTSVVRSDAPDLASRLPLSAWNNGGLDRPGRLLTDRRKASEEEIRDEVFDLTERDARLRERLAGLGLEERQLNVYLRRRYPFSAAVYYTSLATCLSLLAGLAALSWYRRRELGRRVARIKARRSAERGAI